MWVLPRLRIGGRSWALPLHEQTALELTAGLLEERSEKRLARFAKRLSEDASLTLWVLCRGPHWLDAPPTNWVELATWLEDHAVSELTFDDLTHAARRELDAQRGIWADLAANSTPPAGQYSFSRHLLRMLAQAEQWLASSGPAISLTELSELASWLPRWLPGVASAPGVSTGEACESCQHLAESVRQPWTAPSAESVAIARVFPELVARLQRLHCLEQQFASELERAKLESLKQLAYGASHEINNPLANIATRAQSLLRDETDTDRKRKLTTIVSQAFRAHDMISDLMLFARPPALQRSMCDAKRLLEGVLAELQEDAKQQETQLRLHAASGVLLTADETQMAVAVKALVRNALEALGHGGTVDVRLAVGNATDEFVEMVVSDSGPGMTTEVRQHLFDPFYSGREAGRGLGFGLTKCWRIVTEHGGSILVESQPGAGTQFTVRLPRTPQAVRHARTDPPHDLSPPHPSAQ